MKILLLSDSLGAGGAQRQLCGLAVMLKNIGYEVSVDSLGEGWFPSFLYIQWTFSNKTIKRTLQSFYFIQS